MTLGNPGNSSGTFQYNVDYSFVFRNNTLGIVLEKPEFKLYLKENIAGKRIPRKGRKKSMTETLLGRGARKKLWQEEEHEETLAGRGTWRNPGRKRSTKKTLAGRGVARKPWQDEEKQGDPARKGRTKETQEGRGEWKKPFAKDEHSGNPGMKRWAKETRTKKEHNGNLGRERTPIKETLA
jgi:hypothetical protein